MHPENATRPLTSAAAKVHNAVTRRLHWAQHLTPRLKMNRNSSLSGGKKKGDPEGSPLVSDNDYSSDSAVSGSGRQCRV